MSEESTTKPLIPSGCMKGCVVPAILVLVAASVIGAIIGFSREGSDPITLRGEVLVSRPGSLGFDTSCNPDGHSVLINAVSNGAESVQLGQGTRQSDGSCSFSFVVEVPTADRYVFTMPGTDAREYSFQRTHIDTNGPTGVELTVTLRW